MIKINQLNQKVARKVYLDINRNSSKKIWVAGSGRSGTTWLAELLNFDNRYRYIFEPFHRKHFPSTKLLHRRKYIRPDSTDQALVDTLDLVLEGKVRSEWADSHVPQMRYIYTNRMIKSIRSNLFLKWLHRLHPEVPIILIVRDPLATVLSQVKTGWWDDNSISMNIDKFYRQPELVEDFLSGEAFITPDLVDNQVKSLLLSWAIENYVPLTQFDSSQIFVVSYEDMVTDPEPILKRMFEFIGDEYDSRVLDFHQRKSATTIKTSLHKVAKDYSRVPRDKFDSRDLRFYDDMMDRMDFKSLYSKFNINQ